MGWQTRRLSNLTLPAISLKKQKCPSWKHQPRPPPTLRTRFSEWLVKSNPDLLIQRLQPTPIPTCLTKLILHRLTRVVAADKHFDEQSDTKRNDFVYFEELRSIVMSSETIVMSSEMTLAIVKENVDE